MADQYRKYMLTINNPVSDDRNMTHERIKEILSTCSTDYFCMGDEVGENGTFHTHVYVQFKSPIRFKTLSKRFPVAHIDPARGSAQENIEYLKKEGKWAGTSKSNTTVPDSFEEVGTLPLEAASANEEKIQLQALIKDGKTTKEIVEEMPKFSLKTKSIDELRQCLNTEKYKKEFRKVNVTYLYGETGVGKTYHVMKKHGPENICRITSYNNDRIFDSYQGQSVLVFEEFDSQIPLSSLLTYLDIYPVELPARYYDRTACYTSVYILSNMRFEDQYRYEHDHQREKWNAFERRINNIFLMTPGNIITVIKGSLEDQELSGKENYD